MYLKKIAVLAAVVIAGAFGQIARADFYFSTEQADIDAASAVPANAPPLENVIQVFEALGRLATNTYAVDAGGASVRTVGMAVITSVQPFGSGITGPGTDPTPMMVVFALDGKTSGGDIATFTSGGFQIYQTSDTFVVSDPTTWFAPGDSPFYEATLAAQTDVFQGFGSSVGAAGAPGDLGITADKINVSAANTNVVTFSQAPFLFNETHDPDNFLTTTTNYFSDPFGPPTVDSVLSIVDAQATITQPFLTLAAQQALFDKISNDLLGVDFATWGTGTITDFTQFVAGSGDFVQNLTVVSFPGVNKVVPEPGTLSLLGIGLVGLGFAARRRKVAKAS